MDIQGAVSKNTGFKKKMTSTTKGKGVGVGLRSDAFEC